MNDKENIYKFLVNNEKFEFLKAHLNKFNPFKILRIEDHEIRHSNVLAWLFNPSENHNLSDNILKKFLMGVASKSDNEDVLEEGIHLLDLQQSNLSDAQIFREDDNIDILIISKRNNFIVIIENKIYSQEHSNQLNRYLQTIKEKYNGYKIFPIFLTLSGDRPSTLNYCTASYIDILNTIEFTLNLNEDRIASEAANFIQFYLKILKEKIVVDEKLKKLCQSIYKENKNAIDLIYSIGNEIDIGTSINEFKKENKNVEEISSTNKGFWFLLPEFKNSKKMNTNWASGYPVSYWFENYYGKMKIVLEIGPFDDGNQRVKFLEKLEQCGISISNRAKEPGRLYTRIYTDTHKIEDWTNHQEITDAMQNLFSKKKLKTIEEKLLQGIMQFSW